MIPPELCSSDTAPPSDRSSEPSSLERRPVVPLQQLGFGPVAILTDASGMVRGISGAGAEFLGYSVDELVGHSLLGFVSPLDDASHHPASGLGVQRGGCQEAKVGLAKCLLRSSECRPMDVVCRSKEGSRARAQLLANAIGPLVDGTEGYSCLLFGVVDEQEGTTACEAPKSSPEGSPVSGSFLHFVSNGSTVEWTYLPTRARLLLELDGDAPHPVGLRRCLAPFHPAERRRILREFAKARRTGMPVSIPARIGRARSKAARWARINAAPEPLPCGRVKWHVFVVDDCCRTRSQLESERREKLLELMVELTAGFVDAEFEHIDSTITGALARAGEFFGIDRAFLFDYDFVARTSSNTHEWVSEGTEPFIEVLQDVPMEGMEAWIDAHVAGEVISIPDVDSYPHERTREILQMQGIKSVLSVPMISDGTCVGFVGFDGVREARTFSEGEISLLRLFSNNLVGLRKRCRATAELERNRKRLLDVISAAGEYVWEIDQCGSFTYVSEQAESAFGRGSHAIIGRRIVSFVPRSLEEPMEQWLDQLRSDPASFREKEYFIQLDDGSIRVHILSGKPIPSVDGRHLGFRGMGLDVTTERNLKRSLQEARTEINTFFDVVIDLVLICDMEGNIVRLSNSWEKVMDLSVDELLGRNVNDFIHPEDKERSFTELTDLKFKPRTVGFLNRWVSRGGRSVSLEWTAATHGGLVFACARDVSLRQEAQSRLRDAYEAERRSSEIKGRLIAMTSHEFRTPLAAIRLAAELLQSKTQDQWAIRKTGTIISKVDFLESVVSDVLDLERIRDSRIGKVSRANLKLEKLSDVLHRVLEEFDSDSSRPRRVILDLGGNPEVPVPIFLVSRIVRNLVENALKYSPEELPVEIRCFAGPKEVEVNVVDRGPGVPSDDASHIFNEFFRGTNSAFVRGTGLGLPIAREAALRLGGSLTYRRDPGGFTVFSLQFPL